MNVIAIVIKEFTRQVSNITIIQHVTSDMPSVVREQSRRWLTLGVGRVRNTQ